jgi:3-methyladenine DNA glycosylase AlkD
VDGTDVGAREFVAALRAQAQADELPTIRKRLRPGDDAFGIRMRDLFATARRFAAMPLDDVAGLLDDALYEVRMGAFCILDFQVKAPTATAGGRRDRCELYLARHDRITTWDMVDRAAPSVVGGHLLGRSCAALHELAESADPLRRRTAVTAPLWFVRHGGPADLAEVLPLAARLAADPDPLVHLAVGTLLKHTGGRDPRAVEEFLAENSEHLPRAVVRQARAKL